MEVDRLNFVKEKAPYSLRSAPESRTFPNAEIKMFEKFRGRGLLRRSKNENDKVLNKAQHVVNYPLKKAMIP